MRNILRIIILLVIVAQSACSPAVSPTEIILASPPITIPTLTATPGSTPTSQPTQPTATPTAIPPLRFAVIGDYGSDDPAEYAVALLVASWNPDLIITTGDNNYPDGSALTIDQTVGQYYHSFIQPYEGIYGAGAIENDFFPSLGNHDWIPEQAQPYLDYFSLPGNERYYQFSRGPVAFFVLDSDAHEPDGVNRSSAQAAWLKQQMENSTATWNVVYFHHPPYSSALHGSVTWMRWPFQEWGADLVLSGHDHTYERLQVDGLTYIVNGLGGGSIYNFLFTFPESQFRYNQQHGAMLITADSASLQIEFFNIQGELIDSFTLNPKP
jgi:tartrate-resistant acid phosphatase type 5